MLPWQPATLDLYDANLKRSVATTLLTRREWQRGMHTAGDWKQQWLTILPRITAIVTAAQHGAAVDGFASVNATLEQSGYPEIQLGDVNPAGFTGWVEHYATPVLIPLAEYLYPAIIHARAATGGPQQMLQAGGDRLEVLARTAVQDASLQATQAGLHAHRNTRGGWYDPPPYCKRCAVIVGRSYPVTTQFNRHPQCDGQVMAVSSKNDEIEWPELDESQIKGLTDAERQAVRDGADLHRVINATTGLVGGKVKQAPLFDRGRRTRTRGGRLSPKGIYQLAGDDRAKAVQLLQLHGYLK